MTQPFTFEALADGSVNVYKNERYIGNVQNAADLAIYCNHENERLIQAGDYVVYCPDCGKSREVGEGYR